MIYTHKRRNRYGDIGNDILEDVVMQLNNINEWFTYKPLLIKYKWGKGMMQLIIKREGLNKAISEHNKRLYDILPDERKKSIEVYKYKKKTRNIRRGKFK